MPSKKENIKLAIKSIGQDLIKRADDIVNDLKYVSSIEIKAGISPDQILNYDVKKNYFTPMYEEEK